MANELDHMLIVGATKSGKTTFARDHLAQEYKKRGIGVIVCDPLMDTKWNADWITDDIDEFMAVVRDPEQCLGCALFIDEGGVTFSGRKFDSEFNWLTTTSRHHGHVCHLISHKGVNLNPVMRENCLNVVAFNIHGDYAKDLARDVNCEELKEANSLPKGHYIYASRWNGVKRGKVWWA